MSHFLYARRCAEKYYTLLEKEKEKVKREIEENLEFYILLFREEMEI